MLETPFPYTSCFQAYIWNKLNKASSGGRDQSSLPPVGFATLSSAERILSVENFMTMTTSLMNCDTWRLFFLCVRGQGDDDQEERKGIYTETFAEASKTRSRVVNSFMHSMCYYAGSGDEDDDADGEGLDSTAKSELITPVLEGHGGRVIAVLQLLNKRNRSSAEVIPFERSNLIPVKLACNQLAELIEKKERNDHTDADADADADAEVDAGTWMATTSISIFSEVYGFLKQCP